MDNTRLPSPPPSTYSPSTYKRKNEPNEPNEQEEERIIKNITKEEQITSEAEWPQFVHPDGGIIKITPWGTLRQFVDPITQETVTKFEDCNLANYSFTSETIEKIYQTPDTPQSIYNRNYNGNGRALRLSPSDEAEGYVIDGYIKGDSSVEVSPQQQQQQHSHSQGCFQPEHENYFGMDGDDEFDIVYHREEDDEMI
ncbi:hypothetical protein SBY92_004670 [Candida maltosa Xu316]|uniref:Uncharacterized protein n=1 Tax=Candida maltosa (strain Xu316) TaxID=1245528 RepID=M3IMP4_CANMX|nr:hypothetical protein G210_1957 [Candida maltosa Xu316]